VCDKGIPDKGDVHAHVTVHAGAIEADVQAEGDAGPRRVASLAIEAHLEVWSVNFTYQPCATHLVSFAGFEDLEHLIRLCLRGVCHGIESVVLK